MEKIKILYLITGLNIGGAERVLEDLAMNIGEKFEVTVISIIPLGEVGKELKKKGCNVQTLDIKRKWNVLGMFFKLLKIVRKNRFEIIHAHLFYACILARVMKIFSNSIVICTIHSESLGGKLRDKIMQITDKLSDCNIAVSQKVAQSMIKDHVVPKNKVKVVYNGINLNKFYPEKNSRDFLKEFNIKNDTFVVISIGRLTKAKGYGYLIESFRGVVKNDKNTALLILGEGNQKESLQKLIDSTDLSGNVFLLGNKQSVVKYLCCADLFVSSSLWEGLPTVILESMACSVPVIATKVGGAAEIIEDDKSGFLIEPKSSETLFDKIISFRSLNDKKRGEIKTESKKVVEKKFSLDSMIRNHKKLYLILLNRI